MKTSFDAKTKTVTVTFTFDPAKSYPVNENTGNSRSVDNSGGFVVVDGTEGRCKVSVNAIVPMSKAEKAKHAQNGHATV